MTGEYFLSEKQKDDIAREKKRDAKADRKAAKVDQRNKSLVAPEEPEAAKYVNQKPKDLDALKAKFLKK